MDKVLLVEDDHDIAKLIQLHLQELSLQVSHYATGEEAMDAYHQEEVDLLILDIMLPGMSGLDVCRLVRESNPEQAILMLTSRDAEIDRVLGLELGADDYMGKPFSIRELQARVRSLLRRVHILREQQFKCLQQQQPEQHLSLGRLHIDSLTHKTVLEGKELELTSTEFDLLFFLASHPEQVFSREQLLSSVWGYHHTGYEHTVNSHINRLRSKVERNAAKPEIVQTVWGVGYKFCSEGVA